MPTLLVTILISLAFTPRGGFCSSRAINEQQVIILILQRLQGALFAGFDDTSRLNMQVNRLQVRCLWMWLSDQEQGFFIISLVGSTPCFVPIELSRLAGGKDAQKECTAIAMSIEFVDASATGTMKAGAEPERTYLRRRIILDAPGAALWVDASVDGR